MIVPFAARLRAAVRSEAEGYHRRNTTPVFSRLSTGPNQALVSRVLKAGDDDPVWGEFERPMRDHFGSLVDAFDDLQLRAAVLSVWQGVENGDGPRAD